MTFTPRPARAVSALLMVALCLWLAVSSSLAPDASERSCEPPVPETDVSDTAADVTMCLDASGRNVQVAVAAIGLALPPSSLRLYRYQGGLDTDAHLSSETALPEIAAGDHVVRTLPVGDPLTGDIGFSPAVEIGGEYVASTFLAVRASDGRLITAATMDSLDEAVLEADFEAGRLTEREYRRRLYELLRVPGSEDSVVTHRVEVEPTP